MLSRDSAWRDCTGALEVDSLDTLILESFWELGIHRIARYRQLVSVTAREVVIAEIGQRNRWINDQTRVGSRQKQIRRAGLSGAAYFTPAATTLHALDCVLIGRSQLPMTWVD
jgi:hypothetical protein